MLIAGIKGAKAPFDHIRLIDEIGGTFSTFSRYDYPSVNDGVFAKFRHFIHLSVPRGLKGAAFGII
jgi:hypothetical protein